MDTINEKGLQKHDRYQIEPKLAETRSRDDSEIIRLLTVRVEGKLSKDVHSIMAGKIMEQRATGNVYKQGPNGHAVSRIML